MYFVPLLQIHGRNRLNAVNVTVAQSGHYLDPGSVAPCSAMCELPGLCETGFDGSLLRGIQPTFYLIILKYE